MKLEGRVALITGASRGVGRACALALARAGADVVLASKTVEPDPRLPGTLGEVAREVESLGRRALVIQTDVRFEEQIQNAVAKTVEAFGRVDILINNAGALHIGPFEETSVKKFDLVMGINVRATFIGCHEVLPHMIRNRWGHIVNMSPPIRLDAIKGKIPYLISKYGMSMITRGLGEEVHHHNIAVHSLWPACAVESAATIKFALGSHDVWRKPEILADATLALVDKDPSLRTGGEWIDEDVLREEGIEDFSAYSCVPGKDPIRLSDFF